MYTRRRKRRWIDYIKGNIFHGKNYAGIFITLVQLAASIVLVSIMWISGMIPGKYVLLALAVLLVLFGATFGLQFVKNALRFVGIVVSVLISAALIIGITYFVKVQTVIEDVGGATYKLHNMVVVVRADDAAETLLDAADYKFGLQTAADQENTESMLNDIQSVLEKEIDVTEYDSIVNEAQALLDGEISAAIYNEAFTSIIEDSIEDYSDQVRILYQYGIQVEIEQVEEQAEEEKPDVRESFNLYISGIDVSGPITMTSRSDVNIIMTVNPNTKKILLTTTPRDYYVVIPGISGSSKDKLTHAGIYGVDASIATLEALYDIDIAYYARVNFTSLITLVDALGGITVESEYAFSSRGYTFVQGSNALDGAAALVFARERYSFSDGDNQRGKNQELVLTAILRKMMTPAILKNANSVLASMSGAMETNMTAAEISTFINMQLSENSLWSIESVAATGYDDSAACYSSGSQILYVMQPNMESINEISEKITAILEEGSE